MTKKTVIPLTYQRKMDGVNESRMKIARFQTFWIQMQKNKPLDGSRKTGKTSGDENGILLKI
ncbi:hypothetical protein Hanom_Chr04g00358781 [Helianthus anomalus]